jgi:hypothetical protein
LRIARKAGEHAAAVGGIVRVETPQFDNDVGKPFALRELLTRRIHRSLITIRHDYIRRIGAFWRSVLDTLVHFPRLRPAQELSHQFELFERREMSMEKK